MLAQVQDEPCARDLAIERGVRVETMVPVDREAEEPLGAGFFTVLAGACLIGVQFLSIARSEVVAASFLAVGVALWAGLTYTIFTAFTVKRDKPSLKDGISSLWLVAVVAAQSIAVSRPRRPRRPRSPPGAEAA